MATIGKMVMGGCLAMLAALLATPAQAIEDSAVCGAETIKQERLQGIPDKLLHSISLMESGRYDEHRRASFAWPWTVMAEGEGRFLPSKAEAVALVKQLQGRGVKNIDVGCMQVNLLAHKDAFRSVEEAFDPASNVAYAARFLVGLHDSTDDWNTAGAYYHSQTPSLAAAYKSKLMSTWNTARNRGDDRVQVALFDGNQLPVGLAGFTRSSAPVDNAPHSDRQRQISEALQKSDAQKAAYAVKTAAERAEAKRIADAYRQARLEEYRLRKLAQQQG